LRAAADGLQIANAIVLDSALAIVPSGRGIGFGGVISGAGELSINGSGTVTLSAVNTISRLNVTGGARLVSANMRALGGSAAAVAVGAGSQLEIAAVNTLAKTIAIDNGSLVFANVAALPENAAMLRISPGGELSLAGSSTIALTGDPLVSGRAYRLVRPVDSTAVLSVAADTVFDPGAQNAGVSIAAPRIDAATGDLVISAINQSVLPGKDVAALFDALGAAAGALDARIGESFLFDTADRSQGARARRLWLRGFGSFGDYDTRAASIGHRDRTYGALAGMDYMVADKFLVGLYGGYADTNIKTDNSAETNVTQPLGGVYTALRAGVFHASTDFMMGGVSADTTRPEGAGLARGSFKADTLSGGAALGVMLGLWEGGFVQPTVSARYTRLKYKSQRENATDPGAVAIDDFTVDRWQGLAGVRVSQRFVSPWHRPGTASLLLGRRFALDKQNVTARGRLLESGDAFSDVCDPAKADGFTAGAGLSVAFGGHSNLALRYECEFSNTHTRHAASLTLGFSW
jgi:outer membrane autotransporter protein